MNQLPSDPKRSGQRANVTFSAQSLHPHDDNVEDYTCLRGNVEQVKNHFQQAECKKRWQFGLIISAESGPDLAAGWAPPPVKGS